MNQPEDVTPIYAPTPIGLRIARLRQDRGLSASALAEKVSDPLITRAVVTNIERGRKRDPSISEVVKISFALDVSPLELLVNEDEPFAAVDVHGVVGPLAAVSGIEWARNTTIVHQSRASRQVFSDQLEGFIQGLVGAENAARQYLDARQGLAAGVWAKSPSSYEELEIVARAVVTSYRMALVSRTRERRIMGPRSQLAELPPSIDQRFHRIRLLVIDILADIPTADPRTREHESGGMLTSRGPALDPETGYEVKAEVPPFEGEHGEA